MNKRHYHGQCDVYQIYGNPNDTEFKGDRILFHTLTIGEKTFEPKLEVYCPIKKEKVKVVGIGAFWSAGPNQQDPFNVDICVPAETHEEMVKVHSAGGLKSMLAKYEFSHAKWDQPNEVWYNAFVSSGTTSGNEMSEIETKLYTNGDTATFETHSQQYNTVTNSKEIPSWRIAFAAPSKAAGSIALAMNSKGNTGFFEMSDFSTSGG